MIKKRITVTDIAKAAGVAPSTVSGVLNRQPHSGRVGEGTRQRILELVKKYNYIPANAARSLVTGKTYHIGYLVSCNATLGLANSYFATILAGIEKVCQSRGYNCIVTSYDLSRIDNFVMPPKLQKRCVDGVILAGAVQDKVIEKFLNQDIPFVLSGNNTDFPLQGIVAVAIDMPESWLKIFKYLASLGHQRIAVPSLITRHSLRDAESGLAKFKMLNETYDVKLICHQNDVQVPDISEVNEFDLGYRYGQQWLYEAKHDRATAVVGNDQWCIGFLRSILSGGAKCPSDVSVVCNTDTAILGMYNPAVTALSMDLFNNGKIAAEILIGLLEKTTTQAEAFRQILDYRKPSDLIIRESTGVAPIFF